MQVAETKARLEAETEASAKLRKTIADLQQVDRRVFELLISEFFYELASQSVIFVIA